MCIGKNVYGINQSVYTDNLHVEGSVVILIFLIYLWFVSFTPLGMNSYSLYD